MKKTFFFKSLFLALSIFSSVSIFAQADPAPANKMPEGAEQDVMMDGGAGAFNDVEQGEMKLTKEQKEKFKQINKEYAEKRKNVKADNKAEMQALRDERIKSQKALLSADQAKKYDEILAKRKAKKEKQKEKQKGKSKGKGQKASGKPIEATPTPRNEKSRNSSTQGSEQPKQ